MVNIVEEFSLKIKIEKKTVTKMMYGWSKYGGKSYGLVQEGLRDTWSCQACSEQQSVLLPPYMFECYPREFIRICSKCHNIRITEDVQDLPHLLSLVKDHPNY